MAFGPDSTTKLNASEIERRTFVNRVEFHRELPSTNDLALELAQLDQLDLPLLVLTELQTSGRGRGENQWWASHGALTFSLLIRTDASRLPKARWPVVSLSVGLAVCEAVKTYLPAQQLGLKWPNDVHVDGRKLAGILIEVPPAKNDMLVIGVGINVNNSFMTAPSELQTIATSMFDTKGELLHATEILSQVLNQIELQLEKVGEDHSELVEDWSQYNVLLGRTIHLSMGDTVSVGRCEGISSDGALLLHDGQQLRRFYAGTINAIE